MALYNIKGITAVIRQKIYLGYNLSIYTVYITAFKIIMWAVFVNM